MAPTDEPPTPPEVAFWRAVIARAVRDQFTGREHHRHNAKRLITGPLFPTLLELADIPPRCAATIRAWRPPDAAAGKPGHNRRYLEYNGERHTLAEWARLRGIHPAKLSSRLKYPGWTVGQVLGFEPRPKSRPG